MFQSDREKSEGLPVAPFMDRDKVTKPTAQIGFLKFVLIPMFETVTKVGQPRARIRPGSLWSFNAGSDMCANSCGDIHFTVYL